MDNGGETIRTKELIMDLFGDYIRYLGGEARLGVLTELLGLFGVEAATTRVTLSRMKRDGWFETRRHGREIGYIGSEKLLNVLDEGRPRIFDRSTSLWAGRWTMLQVGDMPTIQGDLQKFQKGMAWRGFAQLNERTWISPRDIREEAREACARHKWDADVFTFWTGGLGRDQELASRCWDLKGLDENYRHFIREWQPWLDRDVETMTADEALRARVLLVHGYRGHLFDDPMLPRALWPEEFSGPEAFRLFVELHQQLSTPATRRVSELMFPEGNVKESVTTVAEN